MDVQAQTIKQEFAGTRTHAKICEQLARFKAEESMKFQWNATTAVVVCFLCVVLITVPAYGYIDPNAAGLFSQILTPLLVAAAAGLTFFRKRVAAVFAGLSRRLRRRADV